MRHAKTIIAIVALAIICGIGLYRIQPHLFLEMPTAFVQASGSIKDIAYACGGKLLLTSDTDGNVIIWDTSSKTQLKKLDNIGYFYHSNSDGTTFVYLRREPFLKQGIRNTILHLTYLQFSRKPLPLNSLINTIKIKRWNFTGQISAISPDTSKVLMKDIGYNPSSYEEIKGPYHLTLLDTNNGKVLSRTFIRNKNWSIFRFLQDSNYISFTNRDGKTLLLHASDLSTYRELPAMFVTEFSNDHKYIVGIDRKNNFNSWNLKTHQYIQKKTSLLDAERIIPQNNNQFIVYGLIGTSKHPTRISAFFSAQGELLQKMKARDPYRRDPSQKWNMVAVGDINQSYNSDDGKVPYFDIVNYYSDKTVHQLDIVTDIIGNERAWNPTPTNSYPYYAISPNGAQAVFSTPAGMLRFYDLASKTQPHRVAFKSYSRGTILNVDDGSISNNANIDSYTVLFNGDVRIQSNPYRPNFRNEFQPVRERTFAGHSYKYAGKSISPDGKKALIEWTWDSDLESHIRPPFTPFPYDFDQNLVEIRNVKDGTLLRKLHLPRRCYPNIGFKGAWSKDMKYVAFSERPGGVFIYNVPTGAQVSYLSDTIAQIKPDSNRQPTTPVPFFSIDIMPNEKYAAISRNDGTIYLYSLQTHLPIAQLGKATDPVTQLQFSDNGHLIYGVVDNEARSWKVPEAFQ